MILMEIKRSSRKVSPQWLALLAGLLFLPLCAFATTRPIGPELSPIADGLTIEDWTDPCTADSSSSCGTNAAYGTPSAVDEGKLRFMCEVSHLLYDDPIVYPGQPGVAHLHHFFGNTLANGNSTYTTLRTTGEGSCQGGSLNRTAYWFPAMIKTDTQKVVVPDWIEIYYQVNRGDLYDDGSGGRTSPACPSGTLQGTGAVVACPMHAAGPLERGLKAIFGAYPATATFPSTYVGATDLAAAGDATTGRNFAWSCTGGASKEVLWDAATPSNGVQSCSSSTTVQVRLDTPTCWNGQYDHADHYSHLAFRSQDGSGSSHCPATHPYRIPALTVIIAWSHQGESDYSTWKLSSDIFNGNNFRAGETFHTDWFGAWNDATQEAWHKEINGMHATPGVTPYTSNASGANSVGGTHVRESVNGGLGNGTNLINNGIDLSALSTGARYIDIPVNPTKRGRRGRMR
jgi:hypothetical protein